MFSPRLEAHGQFFISGADHIGQEVLVGGGRYEGDNLDALSLLFCEYGLGQGVAIDVGAYIGIHSRFLLSRFQSVVCVEPNPVVALVLEANLKLSGKCSWVVIAAALDATQGSCEVDIINDRNLGSTRIRRDDGGCGTIPVLIGDSLLSQTAFDGAKVDFLKVDVEGAEVGVLRGFQQLLARDRPMLAVECFEQQAWKTIQEMLGDYGYAKFLILDRWPAGRSLGSRLLKCLVGTRVNLEHMPDKWPDGGYDMIVCVAV